MLLEFAIRIVFALLFLRQGFTTQPRLAYDEAHAAPKLKIL